jgi:AcrR family transcriptional regulator
MMNATGLATSRRTGAAGYSPAQMRTIRAALGLFITHGVSGTSLQMIADASGVTKASVYYQFKTKEAIVVAVVEVEFWKLDEALDAAEAMQGSPGTPEALLSQVIDATVESRRLVNTLQHDPVIVRLLAKHESFQQSLDRLFRVLLGKNADTRTRIRVAMVASAIGNVMSHPLVADLDDATLRTELLALSLQFLSSGQD